MSRGTIIKVDRFAGEVEKLLEEYGRDVAENIPKAADYAARYAKRELEATAPRKTGKYAKSWAVTHEEYGIGARAVVYSKGSIAHLLANGHALRRGGRTIGSGRVGSRHDVAAINEQTQELFIERLEKLAQKGR